MNTCEGPVGVLWEQHIEHVAIHSVCVYIKIIKDIRELLKNNGQCGQGYGFKTKGKHT